MNLLAYVQWLPEVIVALATVFASVMSFRSEARRGSAFSNFLLEGVTLLSGIAVVAGVLYKPLFEAISENPVFMSILGMMIVIYALRDISAEISFQSKPPELGADDKKGHR
jgi:hypothetical protein